MVISWRRVVVLAVIAGLSATRPAHADMSSIGRALEAKNYTKAAQELLSLAERGNGFAQTELGLLYKRAQGVVHDDSLAATWLRRAADQNSGLAQLQLAQYYAAGGPLAPDRGEAFFWAALAAERVADQEREAAAKLRDEMAAALDPARLDALRQRAAAWRPRFEDESATTRPVPSVGQGVPIKTGSGFYVGRNRVVTAYHVVDDCGWLALSHRGGPATVLAGDAVEDLAILEVDQPGGAAVEFSPEPTGDGAAITFVGYPGSDLKSPTPQIEHGAVTAARLAAERDAFAAASGSVTHGWSGGPVLDAGGRVIGVIRRLASKDELAASPGAPAKGIGVSATTGRVLRFSSEHRLEPPLTAVAGGPSRTPEEAAKAVVRVLCWR